MIQSAYNLCDMDIRFFQDAGELREDLQRLAGRGTERIFVGSYFCANYFLRCAENFAEEFIRIAFESGLLTTLVVPVVPDSLLPEVKDYLKKPELQTDELVVNDYGMLTFCGQMLKSRVFLGRLFMRQARDPRYEELAASTFRIPFSVRALKRFQNDFRVAGIEMEGFGAAIDAGDLPEGMTLCVHRPWFMMSCDFICEDASASLPIEKKFRPTVPCSLECCGVSHIYPLINGQVTKIGRGLYAWQEADPYCMLPENSNLRYIEYYPYTEGMTV
ncbi:MAG: hypothetical protein IKD85_01785 [Firmicutes bacterium]|nr:hypothetical protein [Bacillota bacterium]